MKSKLLLLPVLALLSASARGATLIQTLDSPGITTTVTQEGVVYTYTYTIGTRPIDAKHEISHITIDLCDSTSAFEAFADDHFKVETTPTTFKFDDIKPTGDTFVFGFKSLKGPELSIAAAKAANQTATYAVLAPTCRSSEIQVPEPAVPVLLAAASLLFLRRRRTTEPIP